MKIKSRMFSYFVLWFIAIFSISSIFLYKTSTNQFSGGVSDKSWVKKSISQRHILIKVSVFNNKSRKNLDYFYNGYLLNESEILIHNDAFLLLKNYKISSLYFTNVINGLEKNIKDDIWQEILYNKNQKFRIIENSEFLILKTNEIINFDTTPLEIKHFLRPNYNYIYSSFYVKNDIVYYDYIIVSILDRYIGEKIDFNSTYITNLFSINSMSYLRNIGSVGSLIVDEIGSIVGWQSKYSKNNNAIFYGFNNV